MSKAGEQSEFVAGEKSRVLPSGVEDLEGDRRRPVGVQGAVDGAGGTASDLDFKPVTAADLQVTPSLL